MGKTAKDALDSLTFKGEGGVSKVNSALLWLNYLNNIEDAYIFNKFGGLIKEIVIDGIDSLEDTMLNLSDISTNY